MGKFERQNEKTVVNAQAHSEASIYLLRISKEENRKHVINLLLGGKRPSRRLTNDKKKLLPDKQHGQATIDSIQCLSHFSSKEKLAPHLVVLI